MHGATGVPNNIDLNGPAFKSFLGRNILKRRLGRFAYRSFRAKTDSNKTGFAGYFGFWYGQLGSLDIAGARVMTCSHQSNSESTISIPDGSNIDITKGNPSNDLPANTDFEYDDRSRILVRNGFDNSQLTAGERMTGDRPTVVSDSANGYAQVTGPSRLNIKFVAARRGLDWEKNFKSNRDLLG